MLILLLCLYKQFILLCIFIMFHIKCVHPCSIAVQMSHEEMAGKGKEGAKEGEEEAEAASESSSGSQTRYG